MEYVLITGVSTGIGYATTKYLLEQGFHVFGSVRTEDDAIRLKNEFGKSFCEFVSQASVKLVVSNEKAYGLVVSAL